MKCVVLLAIAGDVKNPQQQFHFSHEPVSHSARELTPATLQRLLGARDEKCVKVSSRAAFTFFHQVNVYIRRRFLMHKLDSPLC